MEQENKIKTIAVYGASSGKIAACFTDAARELGRLIAARGWRCVNGGGAHGIMGNVTDGVLDHGGHVTGIIPKFMVDQGWLYDRLDDVVITADMHQRKALLLESSDAIVVMAGGIGTLEELFEAVTWRQLHIHDKPIVLLNTDDYYGPLIAQLERSNRSGFMREGQMATLWQVAATPAEAIALLEQ